jgi:signal transduction histidine kinase
VTLIAALVSISLVSRTLDARVKKHLDHASRMIARTGFALNPSILENVKLIVDAEVVTYARAGEVIAATSADRDLIDLIRAPEVTEQIFEHGEQLVIRDISSRGLSYKVAYRPLRSPPEALVAFVVPTSDIAEAKRVIGRTIGMIGMLIVVAMTLLSHVIARSITSPVQQLVEFTKSLGSGDLTQKAEVKTRDEVGSLAVAFNDMVRQLRASEEKLLHSEKLAVAGQLAARVAHDIRNPLSAIKMQAQLLRTKLKSGEDDRETLNTVLREVDRVEWVVKGLLDLASPGELHLEPGDINKVLRETLQLTEAKLKHLKIAVRSRLDAAVPPALLDADRLKQALLNLILNAADAMPNGGTLRVTTGSGSDDSTVTIEICDDGVGMAPGTGDKVFDPFFTTKREGVGLGLVNTKSIVERHGGTIRLTARNGKGTRAVVTLPSAGRATEPAKNSEEIDKE